jgi:HTH-type transcriptional regulator/antitoxin HipB
MRVRTRKELGVLLREARKGQNLTQAQLAEAVGVNRRWVVQVEQGKTSPDLRTLLRALRSLGLEMSIRPRRQSDAAREIADIVDVARRRR